MPQTVELPDELARTLSEDATRLGMSLPDYALHVLATARESTPALRSGAELVEYWRAEGLIGSRPDITDSQTHARELRDRAQTRQG